MISEALQVKTKLKSGMIYFEISIFLSYITTEITPKIGTKIGHQINA